MNFQINNFQPARNTSQSEASGLKTKKIISLALLLSFILSNFIFVFEKSYAQEGGFDPSTSIGPVQPSSPGDPGFIGPVLPPTPGDPGFIGPVMPGCTFNVGSILAGAGGILTSAGSAVYNAGEWLDATILGPKDGGGVLDAGTPVPGGDGGTMSALMGGGGGGIGSALGLISGNGPGDIFGGLEGGSEVPVNDRQTRQNTKEQVIKEKCLDGIAWMAARFFIRKITDDLVRWIRNGANGKPRFIQNLGDYLKETADIAGGLMLEQIIGKENSKMLCEPWRAQIALDVFIPKRDKFKFKAQCKVSDIINRSTKASVNIDIDVERDRGISGFYNDFSQGGWPAFLTMAMDDGSNAIGSYLMTLSEKGRREAEAVNTAEKEAQINKGYLPQVCVKTQGVAGAITIPGAKDGKVCSKAMTFTPGDAIAETMATNISSDLRQLELADEINEIIAAVIDAIRMKRFWEDGIAGRDHGTEGGTEGSSMHGWTFDAEDWNLNIKPPVLKHPKNQAEVLSPFTFDWTDAEIGGIEIGNYLVRVIFPDGVTEKNMLTPCKEGLTPSVSECELSEAAFDALNLGGTYVWQVTAFDTKGNVAGLDFGTNASGISDRSAFIIPKPNLQTPGRNEILTEKIVFDWTKFQTEQEIEHYELILINPLNEETVIRVDSGTSFTISGDEFNALKNGEYGFKVGAFDAQGNLIGRYSKTKPFVVFGKPILESPAENGAISFPYTFDWQESPLATSYEIRIKKKDGFFRKFDSDESQITIDADNWRNPEGDFVWQVRALIETNEETIDEAGNIMAGSAKTIVSEWSEEWIFTTSPFVMNSPPSQ